MNLPNVFGMHLGCKVRVPRFDTNEDYFLHSVQRRGWVIVSFSVEYREAKIEDCKLILKPLSAITEEDKREFECWFGFESKIVKFFGNGKEFASGEWLLRYTTEDIKDDCYPDNEIFLSTEQIIWLASKGYDIGIVPEENKIIEQS